MKDYLVDLLTNRKKYVAQINMLKAHEYLVNDADELERYKHIERELIRLDFCIEQLDPHHREIIESLYFKGYSLGKFAKSKIISKGTVQGQKRIALRKLRAIFEL